MRSEIYSVLLLCMIVVMGSGVHAQSTLLNDALLFINWNNGTPIDLTNHSLWVPGQTCGACEEGPGMVGSGMNSAIISTNTSPGASPSLAGLTAFSMCQWSNISSTAPSYIGAGFSYLELGNSGEGIFMQFNDTVDDGTDIVLAESNQLPLASWPEVTVYDQWQHWCLIYNGTSATLYRNATSQGDRPVTLVATSGVGNHEFDSNGGSGTDLIAHHDEWGIWNRSLTVTEIQELYSHGLNGTTYPFSIPNTAPTVPVIDMPINGSIVSGNVRVNWTASMDTDAIDYSVTAFFTNGSLALTIVSPTNETNTTWKTTTFPFTADGNYYLMVNATDGIDTTSSAQRFVSVDNTEESTPVTIPFSGWTCRSALFTTIMVNAVAPVLIIMALLSAFAPQGIRKWGVEAVQDYYPYMISVFVAVVGLIVIIVALTPCTF